MSLRLNQTPEDVAILHHGDRAPVNIGPLLRARKWRGGQFVKYVSPNVPSIGEFTVEASDGIAGTGFLLNASENYSNPRMGGFRNYTSMQNASHAVAVASGASVVTMVSGGGRFLFRAFETTALTAGGVRAGGPALYSLNDTLKISENGLLCNDPDANLLAATGGTQTLVVGFCFYAPSVDDPRLGIDLKF